MPPPQIGAESGSTGIRGQKKALAVALLPPIAGLTGNAFEQPAVLAAGFHVAMLVSAGLAAGGGVIAGMMISDDVLADRPPTQPCSSCPVAGPPATPRTPAATPVNPAVTPPNPA